MKVCKLCVDGLPDVSCQFNISIQACAPGFLLRYTSAPEELASFSKVLHGTSSAIFWLVFYSREFCLEIGSYDRKELPKTSSASLPLHRTIPVPGRPSSHSISEYI